MKTVAPTLVALAAGALSVVGCGADRVIIDGSSTVYPITEAVVEEFLRAQPGIQVTVGVSGTGGGFTRFLDGETAINDASRPIRGDEIAAAAAKGIDFLELPIAFDGIAVVVNHSNAFVDHLTVEELRRIWQPGSTVATWRDVRAGWPAQPIELYAPGTDSGTFDYFTETVNGEAGACRADFTPSEDDNMLVRGVIGDANALAYFGFAYYAENRDQLKLVPIDGGSGPVAPSPQTINDGSYAPLSRPLLLYVRVAALGEPGVAQFTAFYLEHVAQLAAEVGYVPLPPAVMQAAAHRLRKRITGTMFGAGSSGSLLERLNAAPGG